MTDRSVVHSTFTLDRRFAATPEQVFAAWADPAAKTRWFVNAEGWELNEYAHDFRVGGRETGHFRRAGDATYRNGTTYLDIVPDRRIVFAYTMAREDAPISASLATVEIAPDGRGTRLTFTEQGAFLDDGDKVEYREAGWRDLLEALAAELSGRNARAAG